jgi:hypothetical protein
MNQSCSVAQTILGQLQLALIRAVQLEASLQKIVGRGLSKPFVKVNVAATNLAWCFSFVHAVATKLT